MTASPCIATPEGVLPPLRHAERIVAEMLALIARQQQIRRSRPTLVHEAMSAGNPKAQARTVARIRRHLGIAAIDVILKESGKAGHYLIEAHDWSVWDQTADKEIHPGDTIPAKPWIVCCVTAIRGLGNGEHRQESRYSIFVTHHALSQLAARCHARSAEDLIAGTKAIWRSYHAWHLTMPPGVPTPDNMRLRVELPGRMGIARAALRRHESGGLIVATIMTETAP